LSAILNTPLRDPKRPIASFLFLGPTGVGKTELAKTIAEVYFSSEKNMVRLDMSEYQLVSSLPQLLGTPDGQQSGALTEAVRRKPFSLILLDELEKAHPDILNIFLQVMEDGRLTDSSGRTVDFTNAIIIATSNAGTSYIQDQMRAGATTEKIRTGLLQDQLKGIFKPEFINRFDAVVVFTPLNIQEVNEIAKRLIKAIAKRLEERGVFLRVTDEAVAEFSQRGFDPVYGARPLRRVLQDTIENTLATYLLDHQVDRRDVVVIKPGGVVEVERAVREI
jgi:ATP-dependent Clp protease ATP-binding subunit ClpB